jgi:uncharacterized membrane protein
LYLVDSKFDHLETSTISSKKMSSLESLPINIRLKLAALWTSVTLCYLYGDYFELYIPKKTEGLLTGNNLLDNPLKLFIAAFALAIPAMMVSISIFFQPKIAKWLNMVTGLFFTIVMLLIAIVSNSDWQWFYRFLAIVETVITLLIARLAFHWPKQIEISQSPENKVI